MGEQGEQMNLTTSYLGLKLAHPFMLGASPLTGQLENARRLEDGGCAAIVMHSLFEEQITESMAGRVFQADEALAAFAGGVAHFTRPEKFPPGPDEYLEQVRKIKAAVSIPVIGSLNGVGADGWLTQARLIEQAGADALELNVYYLSTGLQDSPIEIEKRVETLVRHLKERIRIPVAVKLSPYYTAFANLAGRLDAAKADGLVLFNRFYQPDIDVETLEVLQNLRLSTSAELLLRLRWLAILSTRVQASLAATGGVHTALDGIKALLSGADAVQLVSAVLERGAQHFRLMEQGLRDWMARHEYDSIEAFQGRLNLGHCLNPAHFERENYQRILHSWGA
jgi:dihydroorotate dehydrogenase (fumarate)